MYSRNPQYLDTHQPRIATKAPLTPHQDSLLMNHSCDTAGSSSRTGSRMIRRRRPGEQILIVTLREYTEGLTAAAAGLSTRERLPCLDREAHHPSSLVLYVLLA